MRRVFQQHLADGVRIFVEFLVCHRLVAATCFLFDHDRRVFFKVVRETIDQLPFVDLVSVPPKEAKLFDKVAAHAPELLKDAIDADLLAVFFDKFHRIKR